MINVNKKFSMEGYYSFKVVNAKTGKERDVSHIIAKDHKNMILDSGLDSIGNSSICGGCKVGTGSTPVTADQTDLTTSLASTTTIQAATYGRLTTPPYYMWGRRVFRFAQGAATGNLTEVGTFGSSSTYLFSKALIVDSEGNPTTLTILADEWLDVTYELRIYQDLTDKTFNLELLGTNYTVTVRPASVTSNVAADSSYFFTHMLYYYTSYQSSHFNGPIGVITSNPSGTSYSNNNTTYTSYVANSNERTLIFSSGLNDDNYTGGISSTLIRTNKAYYQLGYSPAIPKDTFKTLVVNVTISWSRYDPE